MRRVIDYLYSDSIDEGASEYIVWELDDLYLQKNLPVRDYLLVIDKTTDVSEILARPNLAEGAQGVLGKEK